MCFYSSMKVRNDYYNNISNKIYVIYKVKTTPWLLPSPSALPNSNNHRAYQDQQILIILLFIFLCTYLLFIQLDYTIHFLQLAMFV